MYNAQNQFQKFSQFAYCILVWVWYNKDKLNNELRKGDSKNETKKI